MIWSVCATLEDDARKKLDNWIREHEGVFPLKDTVYDYYVDEKLRLFKPWEEKLPDNWKYNPALVRRHLTTHINCPNHVVS